MLAGRHVPVRPHPGSRRLARWLPIAGFCPLLCGCSVAPMPIYTSLPAQPGARGSAVPVASQGAAPASKHARHAAARQAAAARRPGTYAALGRQALATLRGE